MSGRRQDFIYVADDGTSYAVNLDESNSLNTAFNFAKYTGTPKLTRQPTGLRLRHVVLKEVGGPIKRTLPCPTLTCPAWLHTVSTVILTDYNDGTDKEFEIIKTIAEYQSNPPRPFAN